VNYGDTSNIGLRRGLEGSGPPCAGANLQGHAARPLERPKGPPLHFVSTRGNARALPGVTASDRLGDGRQGSPARARFEARDPVVGQSEFPFWADGRAAWRRNDRPPPRIARLPRPRRYPDGARSETGAGQSRRPIRGLVKCHRNT
jgi:hypothetical protein